MEISMYLRKPFIAGLQPVYPVNRFFDDICHHIIRDNAIRVYIKDTHKAFTMPHSISQLSPVQCPGVLFYCMDFGQINSHCVYLFDILIFEPVFKRERVQVIEIIPAFNLFHKKIIFNAPSYGLCSAVLHLCQHIKSLNMLR